jgi:hypothetical protein
MISSRFVVDYTKTVAGGPGRSEGFLGEEAIDFNVEPALCSVLLDGDRCVSHEDLDLCIV